MKVLKLFIIALCLTSCNQIEKSDLTIIDGVQLGVGKVDFYNQLDSIGLKIEKMYTSIYFDKSENLQDNTINLYKTEVFDQPGIFDKAVSNTHHGFYYSISSARGTYIIGTYILLGRCVETIYVKNNQLYNISTYSKIKGVSQDIRVDLIDKIQNVLTLKYGQPAEISKSTLSLLYKIEKNNVQVYKSDTSSLGETVLWKTKYLNIYLFKGFKSFDTAWSVTDNTYNTMLGFSKSARKLNSDEISCYSLPYIYYELNKETIEKLKLNDINNVNI